MSPRPSPYRSRAITWWWICSCPSFRGPSETRTSGGIAPLGSSTASAFDAEMQRKRARLACVQHDVKHHQFRLRLHLQGRLRQLGDKQILLLQCGLKKAVRFEIRVTFKIHL